MPIKNPFEFPDMSKEYTKDVVAWINGRIKSKNGLRFHDCLENIEKLIAAKQMDHARVSCYYATNMLIKTKSMSEREKIDIIIGLESSLK